jgi:CRISPR type IV-associated protein Csf2
MMTTYLFEGIMTCLTSVSHIGDTHGVNAKLRREKIVTSSGEVEELPVISGNSLRGILRDRGMLHMLKLLGYGVNEEAGEVKGLSLAAFYFLFSGGALTKDGGKGLDVDEARKWRDLIPLVSLFGGAMGNQILPGRAKIGKAIPVCQETAHLLPERFVNGHGTVSIWELVQEEAYTRRDDEKNENLRYLIAPEVRGLLEADARAKREKAGTKEDVAGETGQKQQMRYYIETLAAGTELFWDVTLDDVTPVEFDAFAITLAEFSRFPFIGGKSGVGHGKVSIRFDKWIELNSRLAPQGREIDVPLGQHYLNHLQQNGERIRGILNGLR